MKSFKALVIHDAHLTHETPPAYKVDYWEMMKWVLSSVFKYAKRNEADAVLWTGDVFHRKAATKNPLHFLIEVAQILGEVGIPHYAIAGNHDVKFGTAKLGLKGQPLALLAEMSFFTLLDGRPAYFLVEGEKSQVVKVAGCSFHHGKANELLDLDKKAGEILVALGHFWFGPKSGEFFGEPVYGPDFLGKGPADVYLVGHHHEDQGHQVVGGKQYLVHGSLTRTGAHKSDIDRSPAAGWLEIDEEGTITSKILRPKFPSAADSMDLEKREQLRQEEEGMDEFVAELRSTSVEAYDPVDILNELDPEHEVKVRTKDYLEQAEAHVT